jgi:hypothetical protein
LVEGVVIVASVLLAFGLQAGWESRQEKNEAASLTLLLSADIRENMSAMDSVNTHATTLVHALDELLSIGRRGTPPPEPDSLAKLLGPAWGASPFEPFLASYDVLRGTRAWELIDTSAKTEIAQYVRGPSALDARFAGDALAALTEVANGYGGVLAVVDFPYQSLDWTLDGGPRGDQIGLINDPSFQSWVLMNKGMIENERDWRIEWIERLRVVDQELNRP